MELMQMLQAQLESYVKALILFTPQLVVGVLSTTIFLLIARFLRKRLTNFICRKAEDPLLVNFLNNAFQIINVILAALLFLYVIGRFGIAGSILGAAGVSAIVIGFAFKDIAENFLAGVILAFNRPFRLGDTIETGGIIGGIQAMNLRDTHIKTGDGKDVFIPNGQILKNPLFNFTIDGFLRKEFSIGLDYGSDIEKARATIMSALKNINGILQEEKMPQTLISEFGSSTVNILIRYWIDTFDKSHNTVEINSQAMRAVLQSLDSAGINMPGEIIELKNYNGESLNTQLGQIAQSA